MSRGGRPTTNSTPSETIGAFRDTALTAAVGATVFVVYLRTLYPDLTGGDSGELIGAAASGGVIHPPGYPLYALLGGLFAHLPWGTLAWRFNLLSALCGAGAAALLALAVARWGRSWWAGVAAAGLFAFSPGVWLYAIGAEVFALNNLLVALLLLLTVLYSQQPRRRLAYLGAFVTGLGLSNHHTSLFASLPLAGWVLWTGRRDLFRVPVLVALIGCFLLGLTPYVGLIAAGAHASPITWGATNTWDGFWTHVLRREYGTFQLSVVGPRHASPAAILSAWLSDLRGQLGWVGIGLALIGIGAVTANQRRSPSRFGLIALLPVLLTVGVFSQLGNMPMNDSLHRGIVARFWQQPELFACAFAGLGLVAAVRVVPWPPAAPLVCIGAALLQLLTHFDALDRHDNRLVRSYGAEILRVLPPNTLVLTKGDLITSSMRYLQLAESQRPDVKIVDQELVAYPWAVSRLKALHPEVTFPTDRYGPPANGGFNLRELVEANVSHLPVVLCGGARDDDPSLNGAYAQWPLGLCDQLLPSSQPVALDDWITRSEVALPHIDFTGQARPPGSWEDVVWNDSWVAREARAVQLMNVAGHDESRRPLLQLAEQILVEIVRAYPAINPVVYRHLAMVVGRVGLDTPDQRALALNAWTHYVAAAPPNDPSLPAIRQEIARLQH